MANREAQEWETGGSQRRILASVACITNKVGGVNLKNSRTKTNPDANSHVLIETAPAFTDRTQ